MTLHEFVELRIVDVADRAQFCLDFILIKVHVLAQCVERTIKVPEFRIDYSKQYNGIVGYIVESHMYTVIWMPRGAS